MMKIVSSKFFKFAYAILLLPLCYSVFNSFIYTLQNIEYSSKGVIAFFIGAGVYLILHIGLYKPIKIYIIGHELVHAISAKLCGIKVSKIKVNKSSGMVKVSKVNTFVALSPYFVPIYSLFIIVIWTILKYITKININIEIFMFFLGFTIMFHLVLTIFAISAGQSDFKFSGWLFSLVVIFIINILTLILFFYIFFPIKIGIKEILNYLLNFTIQTYLFVYIKIKSSIMYILEQSQQWKK